MKRCKKSKESAILWRQGKVPIKKMGMGTMPEEWVTVKTGDREWAQSCRELKKNRK